MNTTHPGHHTGDRDLTVRHAEVTTPRRRSPPRSLWPRVAVFVLLTFVFSWVPWLVLVATTGDPFTDPGSMALWMAGGYGPTVAAVATAAVLDGRAGLCLLLDGLRRWRLGRWYLVLALPLVIAVLAVLFTAAVGPANLEIAGAGHWLLLPLMLLGGILFGGLEEIGWRGYLLPPLQTRAGPVIASIAIGLVWSLWHAPLFLLTSTSQASMSPAWFTLHAVALSLILTWLYNGSGGSILLAVLFHGAVNGSYDAAVGGLAPDALDGFLGPATITFTAIATVALIHSARRVSPATHLQGPDDTDS